MSLTSITLILFVALLLFGPEDLPVVARALGKTVYKVKKVADELSREFQDAIETPANVINESLKEKSKSPSDVNKSIGDNKDNELLTYEDANTEKNVKDNGAGNPLAELSEDMVIINKDKDKESSR